MQGRREEFNRQDRGGRQGFRGNQNFQQDDQRSNDYRENYRDDEWDMNRNNDEDRTQYSSRSGSRGSYRDDLSWSPQNPGQFSQGQYGQQGWSGQNQNYSGAGQSYGQPYGQSYGQGGGYYNQGNYNQNRYGQ